MKRGGEEEETAQRWTIESHEGASEVCDGDALGNPLGDDDCQREKAKPTTVTMCGGGASAEDGGLECAQGVREIDGS
jgi:hypothetical protein